jgi:hypothetical protein
MPPPATCDWLLPSLKAIRNTINTFSQAKYLGILQIVHGGSGDGNDLCESRGSYRLARAKCHVTMKGLEKKGKAAIRPSIWLHFCIIKYL